MFPAYEFWQYWRNTTDADVGRFLKLYTELPIEECDRLGALSGSEINTAKVILANEITTLCHGAAAAALAEATARDVFEQGGMGEDLPSFAITAAELADGLTVASLFVRAGLVKSGKEAKRLIAEGGARMNDAAVAEAGQMITAQDLAEPIKLTAGRKRHALIIAG
jgi:tyrosyl-tRNA synthetase